MNGGFEFLVAGIPVRVQWWFFLTAAFLGLNNNDMFLLAAWIGIVFVSVLAHELGHAFAYRSFGVEPKILLQSFGGLTFGRSLSPGRHFIVSIAGPATGLVIGFATLLATNRTYIADPRLRYVVADIIFVNIAWSVFNLMPIMPLDGGNAVNSFLSVVFRRDMTRVARVISLLTGAVVIVFLLRARLTFAALFVGFFMFQNFQALSSTAPGQFRPTVIKPPKQPKASRFGRRGPSAPPVPTPPRQADVPPTGPRPSSPIDTTGWQVPTARRTFDQEVDTVLDALSNDAPELASIAVDRARRLARTPEQQAVADQLQAEIFRRISG